MGKYFVDPIFETYTTIAQWQAAVNLYTAKGWVAQASPIVQTNPTLIITVAWIGPAPTP